MAFMGILLFWIIFVLEKLTIISAGVFLIVGLLFLKKAHTIIAIILFVLSGLNLLVFTGWKIYNLNQKTIVKTPTSIIEVKSSVCSKFKKYRDKNNCKKMDKFLKEYPYMIYFSNCWNRGLLDYSMFCLNTDMMQCALNNGAYFDDPFIHSNSNYVESLCDFLYYSEKLGYITAGVTTDKMIDTVRFALEHGAKVVSKDWNFYETAEKWVQKDGVISRKDEELLNLIKKYL
ncbi:MAG: hypothetical protein K2J32_00540 [Ruminococcus sp.]|nr:hypothetical protein [Ruminococcus sp.]